MSKACPRQDHSPAHPDHLSRPDSGWARVAATTWSGRLRGRTHLDRAVGYIKTHHASYLPPEQAAVVSALRPGRPLALLERPRSAAERMVAMVDK